MIENFIKALVKYFSLHYAGDQILSATVYFDNMPYEDAIQILEHAQAYKVKLCLKRKPELNETDPAIRSAIPVNNFKSLLSCVIGRMGLKTDILNF